MTLEQTKKKGKKKPVSKDKTPNVFFFLFLRRRKD